MKNDTNVIVAIKVLLDQITFKEFTLEKNLRFFKNLYNEKFIKCY